MSDFTDKELEVLEAIKVYFSTKLSGGNTDSAIKDYHRIMKKTGVNIGLHDFDMEEIDQALEESVTPEKLPTFEEYSAISDACDSLEGMDKEKLDAVVQDIVANLKDAGVEVEDGDMNEGFLGTAFGLATGALAGPAVGKAVAKGLGVKEGPLYNLLISRLVGAEIGRQIMKLI